MEQKQRENKEYIARKNAEIAELEQEHEELKARLQELQLITEEKKAQDLQSEIANMKKMIISYQESAEESIATLGEQMLNIAIKYVDIGKSLNERNDSLQTTNVFTSLLTTNNVNARNSNVEDNFDMNLINISTKLETLERALMNKLERKEYGTILVLGGKESNKMHLLNRDRTQWSTLLLKLPTSLYYGGAAYLDGEIYIFGGRNSEKKTYKLNREMKWIQLADMNEERRNINNSYVVFDGCIWVFGGWNYSENIHLNSVEMYIPEKNKWIQMPSMKARRRHAAAAACTGKLFVSGGFTGDSSLRSVECFDPASQKWTMFLDLPSPMYEHAMISDGICLTVLEGCVEKKSVWKINPNEEKATWKELPPMRESRCDFTANFLGDNIFAIGEWGRSKKVEVFNGETWEYGPELPEGNYGMCSIVIPFHLADALSSQQ